MALTQFPRLPFNRKKNPDYNGFREPCKLKFVVPPLGGAAPPKGGTTNRYSQHSRKHRAEWSGLQKTDSGSVGKWNKILVH